MRFRRSFPFCFLGLQLTLTFPALAVEWKYGKESGQVFSYEFEIEANTPSGITAYKGVTNYSVDALSDDQLRLTFRGGLQESTKPKGTLPGLGAIPRPMIPSGFGGPFGNSDFKGRSQTTNRITMNRQGQVLSMEGDSQLPFLLGNVSLLPFEPLPIKDEEKWTHDFGVTINSSNQSSFRHFGHLGAFGPFGERGTQKIQAASESADYSVESKNEQTVVVKKVYRLKTAAKSDGDSVEISGEGRWKFSIDERIPDSLDFKMKISQQEENVTVTIPISIQFQRLDPAVIAKRAEEAQQKVLAAKEEANRPLSAEERSQILNAIEKGAPLEAKDALEKLASKTPQQADLEIGAAVERATQHSNQLVVHSAERALPKWAPEFNKKYEINKLYKGPLHVPSTGRSVQSTTPLFVGQILQIRENGLAWQAGVVQRLLPDGRVEVGFLMGGKPVRSITLARHNLQLAPEEVEQPNPPKDSGNATPSTPIVTNSEAVHANDLREWSDITGRHKIKAVFLRLIDGAVYLKTESGSERRIPIERLSEKDQAFAKQAEETKENPFSE